MKKNSYFWWIYLPLLIYFLFAIGPMVWVVVSSFQTDDQIFSHLMPFSFRAFIPENPVLNAYQKIFLEKNFGRALYNSLIVTITTLIAGLFLNSMCAFGFAAFKFKGRNILFLGTLITFMIPFGSIALPLYLVVNNFGWINTYWALIIPGLSNGLTIFLFRQFFLDIPRDYIDAARVDGAPWFSIYLLLYMRMSIPIIISAGLIIFLFQWESFMWPLIVARSSAMKVIQVAIADFSQEGQVLWSEIFAASAVAMLIPIAIVLPLQRFYIQGITSSGIKG